MCECVRACTSVCGGCNPGGGGLFVTIICNALYNWHINMYHRRENAVHCHVEHENTIKILAHELKGAEPTMVYEV
jgi:hypothetical protein